MTSLVISHKTIQQSLEDNYTKLKQKKTRENKTKREEQEEEEPFGYFFSIKGLKILLLLPLNHNSSSWALNHPHPISKVDL